MPFERQQLFQPTSVDTSAAQAHSALADALQAFGEQVERLANPILAEKGAEAGYEAGAEGRGGTRLPIGVYNRAYNESFLRAYTLDVYADTEADFLRLEQEAQGDPDAYHEAAQKRRDAILAEVRPEAAPMIRASIDERIRDAGSRLLAQATSEAEAGRKASWLNGLDAVRRDASRAFTAGTPAGLQRGTELALTYGRLVDQGVTDHVLTPAEGEKLVTIGLRANATDVALGRLEGALAEPGGDPIKVIRDTLESEDPNFDDEARQHLAGEMLRRLSLKQALDDALPTGAKARWAATEQEATVRLINGSLTLRWVAQQVASGDMDPGLGRALRTALTEKGADGPEDEAQVQDLITNWRDMTVPQVIAMEGISTARRNEYLGKIATKEADWRDEPNVQQGLRRIDDELGVNEFSLGTLSKDDKLKRNAARRAYDERLAELPPVERNQKALEIGDEVIGEVVRSNRTEQVQMEISRRDRLVRRMLTERGVERIEELEAKDQEVLQRRLEQSRAREAELRKQLER